MEIKDKVAFVTGVSKGIGQAVVSQLLEKGAHVCGLGKTRPGYSHERFSFYETNVRESGSVKRSVAEALARHDGRVDILINNAGLGYFGPLEEMPLEQWHEIFEVNVNGTFFTCRETIPVMKKHGRGHIINVSSIAGLQGQAQGAAYCGAKHAVRGISDSLFRELRDFNIKVTAIFPGSTKTNFFDNAQGIDAHDNMMMPEDVAGQILRIIETPDNFVINSLEFRPLQPRPAKK
ncbi:MAG: SDR family NAD(P)-dependent oxidoreductase [Bacteroidia bacterium]